LATNFKEAYQELIKYLYNNVEDNDIYDNWMSFNLRELTELIEKLEKQSLKFEKHYVKPCSDFKFHNIDCLQMDDGHKLGFFNSEADVRPGHAIWITKDEAERLFELFNKPEVTQCDLSQNNKKEVRHSSHD